MKHLRMDYDSIQPAEGQTSIGTDEPVFLLRAKDPAAPAAIEAWTAAVAGAGGDQDMIRRVLEWSAEMDEWRKTNFPDRVVADVPDGVLR